MDAIYSVNWLEKWWTPERNAIGHTPARFKRTGVGTNGILECKFLSENAHHAANHINPAGTYFCAFSVVAGLEHGQPVRQRGHQIVVLWHTCYCLLKSKNTDGKRVRSGLKTLMVREYGPESRNAAVEFTHAVHTL